MRHVGIIPYRRLHSRCLHKSPQLSCERPAYDAGSRVALRAQPIPDIGHGVAAAGLGELECALIAAGTLWPPVLDPLALIATLAARHRLPTICPVRVFAAVFSAVWAFS